MKLKNLMLVMAAAGALTACSSSDDVAADGGNGNNGNNGGQPATPASTLTGTTVSMGVEALGLKGAAISETRALAADYTNAFISPKATGVTYRVQVDPRMGYTKGGESIVGKFFTVEDKGEVYTDTPEHNGGTATNKYVASDNGSGVTPFLVNNITIDKVKEVIKDAGYTIDNEKKSASFGIERIYDDKGKPTDQYTTDNLYLVWYLAEENNGKWIVEGILTDQKTATAAEEIWKDEKNSSNHNYNAAWAGLADLKFNGSSIADFRNKYENGDVQAIKTDLRYDIAQQEHKTWGEIKTSLHIQEANKEVKVTIPVKGCYQIDATANGRIDTAQHVKIFTQVFNYESVNGRQEAKLNVKVERTADNIVITVAGIPEEIIKSAQRKYNDGITFEIHTFYKKFADNKCPEYDKNNTVMLDQTVWNAMENGTTVTYDGDINTEVSRVMSAYFSSDKEKYKK